MKESPPTLSLSPDIKNTTPQLLLLLKKTLKKTKEKENYTVANVQKKQKQKDDGIPHHVAKPTPPLLNL